MSLSHLLGLGDISTIAQQRQPFTSVRAIMTHVPLRWRSTAEDKIGLKLAVGLHVAPTSQPGSCHANGSRGQVESVEPRVILHCKGTLKNLS